jgi:predicted  nucleic acid-binding Zn-ribbon protein
VELPRHSYVLYHNQDLQKEQLRILKPVTPAQLKDINDQIRQKDLEIQELREKINKIEKMATLI